jgi:hypothetical protein
MCNIRLIRHVSKVSGMPHRCIPLQKKTSSSVGIYIQGDSFGTRPKEMRISQTLFIIQFNIL